MTAAFTPAQRDHIQAQLLAAGERLFVEQGLRRTSLSQLAEPAGTTKSSFYAFFESKEALYLEIMLRRAPLIAARTAPLLQGPADHAGLVALMNAHVEILTTDPWYRRLLTHPDELRAVRDRVGAAEVARVAPYVITPIVEFLQRGQRRGHLRADASPEVLLGVLRSVGLWVLHRDEAGDDFDAILSITIDSLARGLAAPSEHGGPS